MARTGSAFLLDTNVVSETTKQVPAPAVLAWLGRQDAFHLSSVTVFELARGIEVLPSGKKRVFLEAWLAKLLAHGSVVHAFDEAESLLAAKLEADARRGGRTVDLRDLFIVATARVANLSVATRNIAHFRGYGVVVFDPFTGEESL
jgi:predicted nucleic acid-binding protein